MMITPAFIEKLCHEMDAELLELCHELEEMAGDPDVCDVEFSATYDTFRELEGRRQALMAEHEL